MFAPAEPGFSEVKAQEVALTLGLGQFPSPPLLFGCFDFLYILRYLAALNLFFITHIFISKGQRRGPSFDFMDFYIPFAPLLLHTHTVSIFIGSAFPNSTDLTSYVTKKYKPVARKVRPIATQLPERYRIVRNIIGDPLERLPRLPTQPAPFELIGRYIKERMKIIDAAY